MKKGPGPFFPIYKYWISLFNALIWIEGILAIIVNIYYVIVSFINKKWVKVVIGIIGIIIVPLLWANVFGINWGKAPLI